MNSIPVEFFDSNIILYIASKDQTKASKADLLIYQGGVISVQVLNEVANAGRRKMGLDWSGVHSLLATVRELMRIVPVDEKTHELGLQVAQRYQLSVWDSMIVASALLADCETLFSEDMQNGLLINGSLRIVNPFKDAI